MSLRELLDGETVAALPIRSAITSESGTVVRAAVARMRDKRIGCAVVVGPRQKPIGIFTERSLLRVLVQGASLDERPVGDFADFRCAVVAQSDSIAMVWSAIQDDGARFVCVVDGNGRVVGLTGQRGMSEFLSECFPQQVAVQRIGGTPWFQQREGA